MAELVAWLHEERQRNHWHPLLQIGLWVSDSIRLTGASRNTLKQHFRSLVQHNHLRQQGHGRGVWYELS